MALMGALGLSQAELARRVGVAQPTIFSLIRSNKTGSKHLHKIARELKTTAAYLAGETDDPSIDAVELAYSPQDREWIELLHRLDRKGREAVLQLARSLGGAPKAPPAFSETIPVLQDKRLAFKGAE